MDVKRWRAAMEKSKAELTMELYRRGIDNTQADAFKVYRYARSGGASAVTAAEAVNDLFVSRGYPRVNNL